MRNPIKLILLIPLSMISCKVDDSCMLEQQLTCITTSFSTCGDSLLQVRYDTLYSITDNCTCASDMAYFNNEFEQLNQAYQEKGNPLFAQLHQDYPSYCTCSNP